ncbi:MAG: pyridoxamine 5'-phosphate oxidase family protein [Acidobacteriota bacterium]|nr:pyridoxamine 5'-phosphate oxidase family protein [Acidobacteriota bacterium]
MNVAQSQALRQLLQGQRIASLGTLHGGEPYVSMIPFALLPSGAGFVAHVSHLASHTKDMLESPRVSLMVVAPITPDKPPQATARATVQGRAEQIADSDPGYAAAREAYLATFPQSVDMFELADFSLFAIRPLSIRLIGGFAQAVTLTPGAFAAALNEAPE